MSIAASDLLYYQSNNAGSTGGTISALQIVDATLNNLFPDVSGDGAVTGQKDYRKVFVKNNHSTLTLMNPLLWLLRQAQDDDVCSIALGTVNDSNPTSLNFVSPLDKTSGLSFPDLAPGQSQGFWILRTTPPNAKAFPAASIQVVVEGDTL